MGSGSRRIRRGCAGTRRACGSCRGGGGSLTTGAGGVGATSGTGGGAGAGSGCRTTGSGGVVCTGSAGAGGGGGSGCRTTGAGGVVCTGSVGAGGGAGAGSGRKTIGIGDVSTGIGSIVRCARSTKATAIAACAMSDDARGRVPKRDSGVRTGSFAARRFASMYMPITPRLSRAGAAAKGRRLQLGGRSVNPAPRTLWIIGGSPGASILRRSLPMCTSMTLVCGRNR